METTDPVTSAPSAAATSAVAAPPNPSSTPLQPESAESTAVVTSAVATSSAGSGSMPLQPQTVASSMPPYPSTAGAEEGAQQETNPTSVSPVSLAATEPRLASPTATGGAIALLELSSPTVTRQPPPTATFSTLQPPKPPTVTAAPTSVAPLKHSEEAVQEAVRDKLVRHTQAVFDRIKEEPGRAAELITQAFSRAEVPLGMVDRIATSFATLSGSLSGDSASPVEPVEDILGVDEDFKMVAFRLNPTSSSSHPSRPPPKTEYPSIPSDSDAGSDAQDEDRHHVILGKAQNIPIPTKTGGTTSSKTRTGGSTTAGKATGKTSAAASSTAQAQAGPTPAAASSSSGTAAPSSGVGSTTSRSSPPKRKQQSSGAASGSAKPPTKVTEHDIAWEYSPKSTVEVGWHVKKHFGRLNGLSSTSIAARYGGGPWGSAALRLVGQLQQEAARKALTTPTTIPTPTAPSPPRSVIEVDDSSSEEVQEADEDEESSADDEAPRVSPPGGRKRVLSSSSLSEASSSEASTSPKTGNRRRRRIARSSSPSEVATSPKAGKDPGQDKGKGKATTAEIGSGVGEKGDKGKGKATTAEIGSGVGEKRDKGKGKATTAEIGSGLGGVLASRKRARVETSSESSSESDEEGSDDEAEEEGATGHTNTKSLKKRGRGTSIGSKKAKLGEGFDSDLKMGNIPSHWHKALLVVYDILRFGPLSPQSIVDAALTRVRPLQNDMRGVGVQYDADGDLLSTLARLERQDESSFSTLIRTVIDDIHLWAMERQAKVDAKFKDSTEAQDALDQAKLRWTPKVGGIFSRGPAIIGGPGTRGPTLIGDVPSGSAVAPPDAAPPSEQAGPGILRKSRKKTHVTLTSEEQKVVNAVTRRLKHPLGCGRRWSELGTTLGSVIFIPLLMLSPELRTGQAIRRLNPDSYSALTTLLRGGMPVPGPKDPEFTARDMEIIQAITFGVRGVLPRILNHALAVADALSPSNGQQTTPYTDVLVVRQASTDPVLGVEEPSIVQSPLSTSGAELRRVYGLEIPGSRGRSEIMTRVPAFLPEGWSNLMKAAQTKKVTLDMAIPHNPNVHSIPPNEFGVDFADRRTCHLAGSDPEDVIPHSSSYARLFDLDASSEPFEEMVASIRNRQRLVRAFVPAATLQHLDEKIPELDRQALVRHRPTLPTSLPPPPRLPPPPPLPTSLPAPPPFPSTWQAAGPSAMTRAPDALPATTQASDSTSVPASNAPQNALLPGP